MRNGNRKKHGIFLELVDFSVYTYVHDIGDKKLLLSPIQDHPHCVLWQSVKHSTARNQYGIPVNDFRKFSGFFQEDFFMKLHRVHSLILPRSDSSKPW